MTETAPAGRPGTRAVWNIADQCLASLATFAVTILAARAGSAQEFGHFALGLTIYLFLLGVSQAMVNNVFLIRYPGLSAEQARIGASGAAGLAASVGVVFGVVVIPLGLLVAGTAGPSLAAIAVAFPILFLQDCWRAVLIGRSKPRDATINDTLRIAVQLGTICVLIAFGHVSSPVLLLAWGLGALPAAVLGAVQVGATPSLRRGYEYARRHSDISRFLVLEWVLVLGAAQISLLIVAWLGSPADVGALRGAQTLLGPMNVLGLGAFSFLLTELVRRPLLSVAARRRFAALVGGVLAVIATSWGTVLALLPTKAGTVLLGSTWVGTSTVIVPMTVYVAGAAAATGLLVVLRSVADTRSTFIVNCVLAPLLLGGVVVGQLNGGVVGAAWGFGLATTLIVPFFWFRMELLFRRPTATGPADAAILLGQS
jgi:O-antigen/teichoic acid export membrane protein